MAMPSFKRKVAEVTEGKVAAHRLYSAAFYIAHNGFAADGFLMTLSLKRAIDPTAGSLLRRELPTGLRDGDGFCAQAI